MQTLTVSDIIRTWPTAGDLAADLDMSGRKGTKLVRMWAFRGRVPSARFATIARAAEKRGFQSITLQVLHEAHAVSSAGSVQ